jgi:hypothetical protein
MELAEIPALTRAPPCQQHASMKQGLFARPGCVVPTITAPTTPSDFLSTSYHFPLLTVIGNPASRANTRGRGGPLQFPRQPSDRSTPPYAGEYFDTRSRIRSVFRGRATPCTRTLVKSCDSPPWPPDRSHRSPLASSPRWPVALRAGRGGAVRRTTAPPRASTSAMVGAERRPREGGGGIPACNVPGARAPAPRTS